MKKTLHSSLENTKTSNLTGIMRFLLVTLALSLLACDKKAADNPTTDAISDEEYSLYQTDSEALFNFGKDQYSVAIIENTKFSKAVEAFTKEPSDARLNLAQTQWLEYRNASIKLDYFYHLSRVAPAKFDQLDRLQFRVAAHPIQPGFIDSFGEYIYSGLVHDIGFKLTEPRLEQQHGLTDPEEVVLGLYAIEFLLFGEEGKRPASDFEILTSIPKELAEQGIKNTGELSSNRRRKLLTLQTSLLEKDMLSMASSWQENDPASLITKLKKLDLDERNRICGQAFVNYLTENLIDLAKLANIEGTQQETKNASATHSRRTASLKLGLAQQLAPMLIHKNKLTVLSEQLSASNTALEQSEHPKESAPVTSTNSESTSSMPINDLATAYQQLKLAIDHIQ